ncbi:putative Aspartate/glutamate/uridylate kinase family protein [Hibiscus syriacus]|uniref:Aspartate/glutamate/uridylate kinase family protein n=1 Tax=Hibiscus syriacus TaxID=106335 RepID=A0A6A3BA04_HIBSY|nr:uncharacterized protein LOC120219126 isoform X2 [Hibiscus syriacus]KAE8713870.1 putative Aspartate/glutamate/uridylate kinase family protein [Hibiscus syriacus]
MAEANNKEIQSKAENPLGPRNFFSMFPKVDLKFPLFYQPSKKPEVSVKKEEEIEILKPSSLFLGNRRKIPGPLEFEAEECLGRTSNPIVLWQVYAIGGIFLVKWIWARWKERKEMGSKKESPNEDEQPPAVDDSQYV